MTVFDDVTRARYRAEGHWGDQTLPAMFAATAARAPDRIGVIDAPNRAEVFEGAPRRMTYAEMQAEIDGYAAALRSHGLGKGSVVAAQLPNIAEMVLIYFAVAKIGAVLSPIATAYRARELAMMSEILRFDAFISVSALKGKPHYEERAGALSADTLRLGLGSGLPEGVAPLTPVRDAPPGEDDGDPDALFAIVWTSGTEGRPKAVPKTHNNMMASSLGAWRLLDLPDGANVLAAFPFVNAAALGGLMMCWMRTAGALVLHQPFDLAVFTEQLATEQVDYTLIAPTLLVRLREMATQPRIGDALRRLRAIGTGAAPPSPDVFRYYQEKVGIAVVNFFGSNEGAQLCSSGDRVGDPYLRATYFPRDGDVNWAEGAGRITANGGVFKLVDPATGAPVEGPGAIGEMLIAGPAMMPGYFTSDGYDRDKFAPDGFFATGDLFEVAEAPGLMRFHGRAKEIIIRGGQNISPAELDNVLSAMPGVREAAAAAYPCVSYGERVCAFIAPEPGVRIDLAAVKAYCEAEGLAPFKWPERVEIVDAIPRNPLMKINRRALSARLDHPEVNHA